MKLQRPCHFTGSPDLATVVASRQKPAPVAIGTDDMLLLVAGARTSLYATFTALQRAAICFGPLGAALMFWWSGNVWKVSVIKEIMFVGMALSAVSILPMFLFNDDKTLGLDSEAYQDLTILEEGECLVTISGFAAAAVGRSWQSPATGAEHKQQWSCMVKEHSTTSNPPDARSAKPHHGLLPLDYIAPELCPSDSSRRGECLRTGSECCCTWQRPLLHSSSNCWESGG